MSWTFLADFAGAACLLLGALFTLIAAIGVTRYPEFLSRQHVVTKPQVFSALLFYAGVILLVRTTTVTWTLLIVAAFQLVSSPISAHILSRAAYRVGRVQAPELEVDELGEDVNPHKSA